MARRDAAHVGHDRGELDAGVLERRPEPGDEARPLLDRVGAVARQVAAVALRRRRDEAGAQQPAAQQVGDLLGVLHVGLAAGDGLDVAGM
jgi:hypothetical protein